MSEEQQQQIRSNKFGSVSSECQHKSNRALEKSLWEEKEIPKEDFFFLWLQQKRTRKKRPKDDTKIDIYYECVHRVVGRRKEEEIGT